MLSRRRKVIMFTLIISIGLIITPFLHAAFPTSNPLKKEENEDALSALYPITKSNENSEDDESSQILDCDELCEINLLLPDYPITMYAWEEPVEWQSMFKIEIEGILQEYDVSDGIFDAWCVEYGTPISQGYENPHTINLSSSYDPPEHLQHQNWHKINYILNHKQGDRYDVQRAIWYFINFGPWDWNYTGYVEQPVTEYTYDMIDDANENSDNWCPENKDIIAIICDQGLDHEFQITIIEVQLHEEQIPIPDQIISANKLVKPDCHDCEYSSSISFDISDDVDFVTYKIDVVIDDMDGTFNEPIENLSIRDNLPQLSGLQYNNSYIKTGDGSYYHDYELNETNDYLYWNFTTYVSPGSTFSIYYCADVIGCGNFENIVNVSARYFQGGPCCPVDVFANDSAFVEVICGPGIEIIKEASRNGVDWTTDGVDSFVDDTVWFKLTIKNTGFELLGGVNVYDYLPDFLEFDEMIDNGGADSVNTSCEGQTYDLRWFFTEIDVGEIIEIVFTTKVVDVGVGENIVTVTSCDGPGDTDSVIVTVDDGMGVEKTVYDEALDKWTDNISALPGDIVQWKIHVSFYSSNDSEPYLHHVLINDTLPDELSYVGGSAVILFSNDTSFPMDPEIDGNQLIWDLNEYFLQSGDWLSVTFETTVDVDAEKGLLENHVIVTSKACDGTMYESEATATVYVTEEEDPFNYPPEITDRFPADESIDVDIDAVLSVTVDDVEEDVLTVVFYDASDDLIIKEFNNINPPKTVEATWMNLEYNTTYEWYVTVNDENSTINSSVWLFTTIEQPSNLPPDDPKSPSPSHNAPNVFIHPTLSVQVSDPDGDTLTVEFYDAATDQLIGSDECISDCRASTIWTGRAHDTMYSWYVKVSDDEFEVTSDVWSFTTKAKDIDLAIQISGGMGVKVDFINNGMDAADDVLWDISIENRGILNRINKTSSGTHDILGDSMKTETLRLFNIGRISIDVTVDHPSLDEPLSENANGFLLGFFVFL